MHLSNYNSRCEVNTLTTAQLETILEQYCPQRLSANELIAQYKTGRRDFRVVDLSNANLSWVDLRGADLRGANLRGANLTWANLRGVDLTAANLNQADLNWSDLHKANLRFANLSEASLCGANFLEAEFSGAILPDGSIQLDHSSASFLQDLSRLLTTFRQRFWR